MTENVGLMRLLACFVAAVVYVWQEQREFSFSQIHFAVFILGIGVLSLSLCLFLRGPSRIQPPESIATALRFIGRLTLEIYAIQLAGSELIMKLVPDLACAMKKGILDRRSLSKKERDRVTKTGIEATVLRGACSVDSSGRRSDKRRNGG